MQVVATRLAALAPVISSRDRSNERPALLTYSARWSTQSVVTSEACRRTKTTRKSTVRKPGYEMKLSLIIVVFGPKPQA